MANPKPSASTAAVTIRNEHPVLSLKIGGPQHFTAWQRQGPSAALEKSLGLCSKELKACAHSAPFFKKHLSDELPLFLLGAQFIPAIINHPPKTGWMLRVSSQSCQLINSAPVPRAGLISLNCSHFKCKPGFLLLSGKGHSGGHSPRLFWAIS